MEPNKQETNSNEIYIFPSSSDQQEDETDGDNIFYSSLEYADNSSSYNYSYDGSMDNKNENEIKIIFHVHLPEDIDQIGQPIVLGDGRELGSWEQPNIILHRPFPQNPTYWQSDPVTISLSNFNDINDINIQYKYAIHISRYTLRRRNERYVFEGMGDQDNPHVGY